MTLQIVGAGLPRTGTASLQVALELLLDAPCYHMLEVFRRPADVAVWVGALQGEAPDWDVFLGEYAAGVDMPLSTLWRELAAAYPEAPVLLSRRESAQVWYASMDKTVLEQTRRMRRGDGAAPPDAPAELPLMFQLMGRGVFTDLDGPELMMQAYERRLADVRREIPPDRLVEWQPGDGWEPLCRALDVGVPDVPFPHENTTAVFRARARGGDPVTRP